MLGWVLFAPNVTTMSVEVLFNWYRTLKMRMHSFLGICSQVHLLAAKTDVCVLFRYTYAFKRHIEKNHEVVASDEEGSDDDNEAHHELNNENLDEDDARGDPPVQDEDLWDDLSEEKITDMVAISIARMKASSSIVQSTIDMVVAESSALFLKLLEV